LGGGGVGCGCWGVFFFGGGWCGVFVGLWGCGVWFFFVGGGCVGVLGVCVFCLGLCVVFCVWVGGFWGGGVFLGGVWGCLGVGLLGGGFFCEWVVVVWGWLGVWGFWGGWGGVGVFWVVFVGGCLCLVVGFLGGVGVGGGGGVGVWVFCGFGVGGGLGWGGVGGGFVGGCGGGGWGGFGGFFLVGVWLFGLFCLVVQCAHDWKRGNWKSRRKEER